MTVDGAYQDIDGKPALVFERELRHPVEAVWRAVTEPDQLKQWFPAEVTVDVREGGAMTFTFPDGDASESKGEVTYLDPPNCFQFKWGEETLRFDIEPAENGSRLRFIHFIDDRGAAARDAAGWHVCLDLLERSLTGDATQGPTSEPTDEWRDLYEKYVGAGLPSGAPVPD